MLDYSLSNLKKFYQQEKQCLKGEDFSVDELKRMMSGSWINLSTGFLYLLGKFLSSPKINCLHDDTIIFYQDFETFCNENNIKIPKDYCYNNLDTWKNVSENYFYEINLARNAVKSFELNLWNNGDTDYLKLIFASISSDVTDLYIHESLSNYLDCNDREGVLELAKSLDFIPSTVKTIHLEVGTCKRLISPTALKEFLIKNSDQIDLRTAGSQDIQLSEWNFSTPKLSSRLSMLCSTNRKQEMPSDSDKEITLKLKSGK